MKNTQNIKFAVAVKGSDGVAMYEFDEHKDRREFIQELKEVTEDLEFTTSNFGIEKGKIVALPQFEECWYKKQSEICTTKEKAEKIAKELISKPYVYLDVWVEERQIKDGSGEKIDGFWVKCINRYKSRKTARVI